MFPSIGEKKHAVESLISCSISADFPIIFGWFGLVNSEMFRDRGDRGYLDQRTCRVHIVEGICYFHFELSSHESKSKPKQQQYPSKVRASLLSRCQVGEKKCIIVSRE